MAWFAIAERKSTRSEKGRSKISRITINILNISNALNVKKFIIYNPNSGAQGWENEISRKGKNMKVRVDKETCVGDETCVDECPEVFEMQGDVAAAKMENVPNELEKKVEAAAKNCPVEAIIIE
jgi:ferredoxin